MAQARATRRGGWIASWLLGRGGGLSAHTGLLLGGAIMLVVVAGAAWSLFANAATRREMRAQQVETTASVLARTMGELLARGDGNSAQGLIASAATTADMHVRVLLPDGSVLLDSARGVSSDPGAIPARWEGTVVSQGEARTSTTDGNLLVETGGQAGGRGSFVLSVQSTLPMGVMGDRRTQLGMAGVGLLGLGASVIVILLMRERTRGLVAIGRALSSATHFDAGELPTTALRLSEDLGDEAIAWNRVLDERDRLREQTTLEEAANRFGVRASEGSGEYAQAFDAMWMGVLILGPGGEVHAANGAAAVLLKKQRQELSGVRAQDVLTHEGFVQTLAGVLSGTIKQRTAIEIVRESDTGERSIVRCTIRPLRREDGASAMVVLEDVTQQRVADESRNSFVAQATHELRTPLTTIRLYHEQLVELGDGADPVERGRCLNVIGSEVRRLERIVGDMLSVSEIEAGTFRLMRDDVRLDEILRTLEQEFVAQATDKEITLQFEHAPKLPMLSGDRDKVVMALHNLIANAIKYTPAGGQVNVRAAHEGNCVTVDVADNGIGIEEGEQELVFQKFYRSRDKRVASISGSGIGLALAREVVRLHGGDITIKSQLDRGSTFTLMLPAIEAGSTGVSTQRAAA